MTPFTEQCYLLVDLGMGSILDSAKEDILKNVPPKLHDSLPYQ